MKWFNKENHPQAQKSNQPLKAQELWLEAFIDNSPEIFLQIDEEGNILYCSRSLAEMLGYKVQDLTGKSFFDCVRDEDLPGAQKILQSLIQKPGHTLRTMLCLTHKDGSCRWTEISFKNLLEDPAIKGIIINGRDLTQRKQYEERMKVYLEKLIETNKELEQFAFVASHDMQEPLRIISSYAQLWAEKYKGKSDEKADKYISYILTNTERIQTLINDLLAYSRVGRKDHPLETLDASTSCDEAILALKMTIEEKNAKVSRDKLPQVEFNHVQLVQIFQNLISNAIKYCSRAPQVHISVVEENDQWVFAIKDNGIGIDFQYSQKVFEVFQRLHPKSEYPGTGLGLSICKRIIEQNGGRIWVNSQPGQGSTFYFTVPKRPLLKPENN